MCRSASQIELRRGGVDRPGLGLAKNDVGVSVLFVSRRPAGVSDRCRRAACAQIAKEQDVGFVTAVTTRCGPFVYGAEFRAGRLRPLLEPVFERGLGVCVGDACETIHIHVPGDWDRCIGPPEHLAA
tara:strand:- start:1210 stop:1590 length:381 start_codon:yes stop_codon:yes gene_type:complete